MDDNGFPNPRFSICGRELVLRANARALRLITEHTGHDLISMAGQPIGRVLASSSTFPRILWALAQNQKNGPQQEWPDFDWIEENLDLMLMPAAAMAIAQAIAVPQAATEAGDEGNVQPEAIRSTGVASGQ